MSHTTSHPPTHLHTSHPLPPSAALSLLSTYLDDTTRSAHLHPTALLTENGPESTGADVGPVLHNLRRVEKGLRGEIILGAGGEEEEGWVDKGEGDGWQDMREFERGRDDGGEGEFGGRGAEARNLDGMGVPRVEAGGKRGMAREGEGGEVGKEERRRRKKEKRNADKVEREKRRAGKR